MINLVRPPLGRPLRRTVRHGALGPGGVRIKNVYCVRLGRPVKTEPGPHHFTGKESSNVFVVASTIPAAYEAVGRKYPGAEVRGVDVLNYSGLPIVIGD